MKFKKFISLGLSLSALRGMNLKSVFGRYKKLLDIGICVNTSNLDEISVEDNFDVLIKSTYLNILKLLRQIEPYRNYIMKKDLYL